MRTNEPGGAAERTFTQVKRRDQLVDCMIDAIAEVGFPRASVAEVARRAGVSKGVVTYHFAAKDDLIRAVIADVLASMRQYLEPRILAADPALFPERFVAPYITGWVGYYRTHARQVLALVRIYNGFRDESGRPNVAVGERAEEVARVAQVLKRGQVRGGLGAFDTRVTAAVMKAALDDLLIQFANDPDLDLEAYGAELVAMFERATRLGPPARHPPDPTHPGGKMKPYFDASHLAGVLLLIVTMGWGAMELAHAGNTRDGATGAGGGGRRLAVVPVVIAASVLLYLAPHIVPAAAIRPGAAAFAVGLAILLGGLVLRGWSIKTLGEYFTGRVMVSADQPVITAGPYRLLRHPSYTGLLLACAGVGLAAANWVAVAAMVVLPLAAVLWRIHAEENALLVTLGDRYRAYAGQHKRLVPLIW